jgi:diguanylate cyclase (GGDEF)-like protein
VPFRRFPYAFPLGVAVVVMAACVWQVGHSQREAATRSFHQAEQVRAMLTAMVDQETGLRGYLLVRRRPFLDPYFEGGQSFARALAAARRHGGSDRVELLLTRSEELATRWRASADTALRRPRSRVELSDALGRKALMDRFRSVNRELRAELGRRRAGELSRATTLSAVLILGLSALFGLTGWLLVGRPVAAQRRREQRRAELRERQTAFARALQMSDSEAEAHALLTRHFRVMVPDAGVTVLERERSGPPGCLAMRLVAPQEQGDGSNALLQCSTCGKSGRSGSLCSPLVVSGDVVGAVHVAHDGSLDPEVREQITDKVAMAAPVIANLRNLALAQERAATDALTGLANRRALNDAVRRMLAQAARTGGSLSAIALDLDRFKQINDRHGHDKGDDVLAATAAALTGTLRTSDFVARSGGEEFLVLLPDTGLDGAFVVAENLRAALQAMAIPGLDAPVTGSFGVATHPEDAHDGEALLRAADRALYLAKRNGRNRVEAAASAPALG